MLLDFIQHSSYLTNFIHNYITICSPRSFFVTASPLMQSTLYYNDAKAEAAEDAPTVLIFSDRINGLIPTIGSMIRATSVPINIVLIGKDDINKKAHDHFHSRTASFVTMTVNEAQQDITEQGLSPIWNWKEWHSSIKQPGWKNDNTIHVADWDELYTHAHELNHLRFYAPYLRAIRHNKHVFFIDDDLLVQTDLHEVSRAVSEKISPTSGLTCPCNIWLWNDECHRFGFKSQHANILETAALYGGRPECKSPTEENCLPANFEEFVSSALPKGMKAEDQTGEMSTLPLQLYILCMYMIYITLYIYIFLASYHSLELWILSLPS